MLITGEIRVVVVADDPLVRAGLKRLLEDDEDIQVVGQISEDEEIEAALNTYQPDAVVWDLGWEPSDSIERLAEVSAEELPVIALLPNEMEASDAYTAGARGLLLRETLSETLAAAVRAVIRGLVVRDLELSEGIPAFKTEEQPFLLEELTLRELEVLSLLAEGLTNKAIAQHLGISEYTVKFHVNTIFRKLGAQSRTEAAVRAARLGLITL
ncbi:MAG: response regulator transcription factor [Anaerolineaceae bacterium]|nr:MAG: response regulator transcription factor [Anaerolineaceae bacterium]